MSQPDKADKLEISSKVWVVTCRTHDSNDLLGVFSNWMAANRYADNVPDDGPGMIFVDEWPLLDHE